MLNCVYITLVCYEDVIYCDIKNNMISSTSRCSSYCTAASLHISVRCARNSLKSCNVVSNLVLSSFLLLLSLETRLLKLCF